MSSKQETKSRISAAEKGCNKVQAAWVEAIESLSGGVSVNGCGIYHDQGQPLRRKLLEAKKQINTALAELDAIDWPADADYDHF